MQTSWLIVPAVGLALVGCDKAEFKGAEAKVTTTDIKLDMPSIPSFDLPSPNGDTYSPKYMRLLGHKLLDTEVKIKGHVTWIYDCLAAVQRADEKPAAAKKRIKDDPRLCKRPHFYVGDTAETAPERSIWVVEVPRKLRDDEKRGLNRADLAALPPVPKFKLGDEVVVTGKWSLRSPRGFSNTDGLLVYGSFQNLTSPAEEKKK